MESMTVKRTGSQYGKSRSADQRMLVSLNVTGTAGLGTRDGLRTGDEADEGTRNEKSAGYWR